MKEKLIEIINNLSERERVILVGFLSFVMIFIFVAIWFFMNSSIEDKKNTIAEQEKMIQEMVSKKELFKKAQAQSSQIQDGIDSSNVNLNSDISTVKESVGIQISSIKEIKPRKKGDINIERIELNLREVPLDQTLTFMYGLENKGRYVFVDSITIKKRLNKQNYDVSLVVAAMKKENANGN
ncbi:type II secretion system protein M [bacterium]|nr:type II secretion system protein M [bacterium]